MAYFINCAYIHEYAVCDILKSEKPELPSIDMSLTELSASSYVFCIAYYIIIILRSF